MTEPTVALALGSGGARGYAHLGVVEALTERGHRITGVSGTSMGALVGACVAAGRAAEMTAWAVALRQRDVLRLVDPGLSTRGAVAGSKLLAALAPVLGDWQIEDLPIPFTAVATDLRAAREIWFQRGPLLDAVRASIAIPGAITPFVGGDRILVDGGLLNPLPIEPLAASPARLVVAVSLQGPRTVAPDGPARDRIHAGDVVSLSLYAMQQLVTRYRLASQAPDVVIDIPLGSVRTLDFHRAAEMIALGRDLAHRALDTFAEHDRPDE